MTDDEPRCLRELEKEGQMELNTLSPMFRGETSAYGYCPTCKQPAVQCDKGTGIAKCSLGHTWQAIEQGPIPDLLDPNRTAPYGVYCPVCGAPTIQRKDMEDTCGGNPAHTYQTRQARVSPMPKPPDELAPAPDQPGRPPVPSILPRPDSPWTNPFVSMTSDKGVIKEHNGHHHLHVSDGGMDGEFIVGAEGIERYADGERVSVQLIISKIKPSEWTH